jgi:hypothetical protein
MNETIGSISVLVDNANNECRDWRNRCQAIVSYVCANFPIGHTVRNSVLDLVNDKERTKKQRAADADTIWTKFHDCRDYSIRLREMGMEDGELAAALDLLEMWPPPHTNPEDIT